MDIINEIFFHDTWIYWLELCVSFFIMGVMIGKDTEVTDESKRGL
jgi:hypothetical protein